MRKLTFIAIAILCVAGYAPCQTYRATLTGLVTDSSGAVVPNAPVEVVNANTGATTTVKSNGAGSYTVPFLQPGNYNVSVHMDGFKTYTHSGLELQVEATVRENIVLQVGSVNESVVVTTATPMIDVATADMSQTLSAEEVRDLPNNGNSPFSLERNMYGVLPTNATRQLKPTDNTNANQVSIAGGQQSSGEVLLNGIPDMESSSRQVSYIPSLDSVDAVHVDQFSANAALGDTIGGTVNITTKSGTNSFHGTLTEYYNGSRPFIARKLNSGTVKSSNHYQQPNATIGGPVFIPHVFNGHNRVFFFYSWEGYYQDSASPTISSVPTADERNGDFHSTLGVYGASAQLYDPYYAPGVTSTGYQTIGGNQYWIRAAIPNNCITATTAYCSSNAHSPDTQLAPSPIAQAYLKLLPLPNYSGTTTKADGENNYISYPVNSTAYNSHSVRLDWNISNSDKIFGELHLSNYTNRTGNVYGNPLISGANSVYKQPGGQIDNVKTFSPSLSLETRLGYQRYNQVASPNSLGSSPSLFGFAGYVASSSVNLAVPQVGFSDGASVSGLSSQTNGYGIIGYLTGYVVVNKTWGNHSLKAGTDVRVWKKSGFSPMNANGNFSFSRSATGFMAQSPNYGPYQVQQNFGAAYALFFLGLPSSATYQVTQKFQYDNWYSAYFLQDDWKARRNLTFSLGLRLDHETAVVESTNHMIQNWYGDKPNSASSTASAAYASQFAADQTALAASADPSLLPSPANLKTTGATVYETPDNRYPYHPAPLYVSPRIGFAYSPNSRFVIRGGFAIVNQPFGTYTASATTGYTQATSMVLTNSSVNGGYTPITTWENPYPTNSSAINYNPISLPLGNTQGVDAGLGTSLFFFHDHVKVPYTERFSLDIQKEFAHGWMAEIGAMHTLSLHNSIYNNINNFPYTKYMVHSSDGQAAGTLSSHMSAQVTNPFYHLFPTYTTPTGTAVPNTTPLNTSAKIQVMNLLLSYPAFTSVSEFYAPASTVHFNGLTARLQKRMSKGLEMNANFEWSRQIGATVMTNPGVFWVGETNSDYPVHLAVTWIYELPFGRGRQFMSNTNRVVNAAFGGWKVSGEYQYLSGPPLSWGNVNYTGNFKDFNNHPHLLGKPSFNTAGFVTASANQPGAWNYRTFPQYLLRADATNNFNFSALKDFVMADRFVLTARVDAFNALNHPQYGGANLSPTAGSNFGVISSQANDPRSLAGGLHLRF